MNSLNSNSTVGSSHTFLRDKSHLSATQEKTVTCRRRLFSDMEESGEESSVYGWPGLCDEREVIEMLTTNQEIAPCVPRAMGGNQRSGAPQKPVAIHNRH